MPAAATQISGLRAWGTVAVLMIAYTLAMLDRTILSLMVVPIERDLAINDTELGLLQGLAFALFYAVAGLPMGRLADIMPRRTIIGVGIALWSVMTALSGFAQRFAHLFLARFGVGVGEAALNPAGYSMLADLFPKETLGRATAAFSAGGVIGSGLAFLCGGLILEVLGAHPSARLPLIGVVRSWQIAFFVVGIPGLLVAALMFMLPEPTRGDRVASGATVPLAALGSFLKRARRPLLCYVGAFSGQTLVIYATLFWAPTMLVRRFHLSTALVGLIMAGVVGVFGLIGFLVGGEGATWLLRRGYDDANLRVGLLAGLCYWPFALGMTLTRSLPVAVTCLCMVFLCATSASPAGIAGLQLMTPVRLRAQVSSIFLLLINLIGLGCGALIVGALTDHVFKDKAAINLSLLCLYVGVAPLIIAGFAAGLKPAARWIAQQEKTQAVL